MNRTGLGIFLLLGCIMAAKADNVERRVIEVEEFDGLKRFPYNNTEAKGWYARESNCRSYGALGKGYHAQIHESAQQKTARKSLTDALPAGDYQVFVRVVGNSWHKTPNEVALRLGKQTITFDWQYIGKRFKWLPGKKVKLTTPVKNIAITATKVGGYGFHHLYETTSPTIAIDSIYITSDLTETSGPASEGETVALLERDLPLEALQQKTNLLKRRHVKHTETPGPLRNPKVGVVKLKAFDKRRNLWPNSSFEIGGNDGWAARNSPNFTYPFSEKDHLKGKASHGQYSLRIPAGSRAISRVVELLDAGQYTLSLYLKSKSNGNVTVNLLTVIPSGKDFRNNVDFRKPLLSIKAHLSQKWQRVMGTANLPAGPILLQIITDRDCAIDAVQLEPGSTASPYQPRAEIEAGLATNRFLNLFYDDEPVSLQAWATNSSDKAGVAKLQYEIVDVRDAAVQKAVIEIPVPANSTVVKKLKVKPVLRGLFSVLYAAQDRPMPEGELIYGVLPKIPETMPRHALACNMDPNENVYKIMEAMGHKWQLYCKLKKDWPGSIHPSENTWNWDAAKTVINGPKKYGFQVVPGLWPVRVPDHMMDKENSTHQAILKGKRQITRSTKRNSVSRVPDLAKWREYCRKVAENLGDDAEYWGAQDEVEGAYTPKEFAPILQAENAGFKDAGKKLKVALSCTPDYTEDIIEECGGRLPFQAFGGSSYNFEYWDSVKVRGLKNKYKLPWICYGVGHDQQPQMHHSFPGYMPVRASAARTAREMVRLCLVQDADVIGHYTGRINAPKGLYNLDCPLMDYDCSPLPHGFSYSCVGLLLANAVPIKEVYVKSLDLMLNVYRQNKELGAVTWAGNTPNLDIHWKPWPKELKAFTFPAKVKVLDMFGNPQKVEFKAGKTTFDLGEEPVFIISKDLSEKEFLEKCQGVSAAKPDVEIRTAFIPGKNAAIDLGVWVKNNTKKTISNLELDANFAANRMVSRTEWILTDRKGKITTELLAGKTTFGRFPTSLGLDYPVENATFTVWLKNKTQEYPWFETCWMTVAPKGKIALTGDLKDWNSVQPAWIYNTFSWARFGRSFPQIVSGAEHIKSAYRLDGRLAIYTGYDEQFLYLGLSCQDDSLINDGPADKREYFTVRFNQNLPGDLSEQAARDSRVLALIPGKDNVVTKGISGVKATVTYAGKGYLLEAAVPLKTILNSKVQPGSAIGFDIHWRDADRDGDEIGVSECRWAGGSRTMGQLFFGN